MDDKLFRDKSMERISSVGDLHDYMRITSPRLWMLLSVILALIVGFIVFVCIVRIENTIDTVAQISRYDVPDAPLMDIDIEIPESALDLVHRGMTVKIANQEGQIIATYNNDITGNGALVELDDPSFVFDEGLYDAQIVLESISPIQFLFH